jgi:hypothetical protein
MSQYLLDMLFSFATEPGNAWLRWFSVKSAFEKFGLRFIYRFRHCYDWQKSANEDYTKPFSR